MNKNAVIALVLLIALVGAFFINQKVTANVVASSPQIKCVDSDATAANPFNVASEARVETTVRRDTCGSWPFVSTVQEATCDFSKNEEGRIVITRARCDTECLDGRCIPYGGSIAIVAKDAQTLLPLKNAEVILYSALLDEVARGTTSNDGSLTIPNNRVTFPATIKKLFAQHEIPEPIVFELHAQQYEASVQALRYATRIARISFEHGKDVSIEVLLDKSENPKESAARDDEEGIVTGRAIKDSNDDSSMYDVPLQELAKMSVIGLRGKDYVDPTWRNDMAGKKKTNADGSTTIVYEDGVTRTISKSPHGSTIDMLSDNDGSTSILVSAPDGSTSKTAARNGKSITTTTVPQADGGVWEYDDAGWNSRKVAIPDGTFAITQHHPDGSSDVSVERGNNEVIKVTKSYADGAKIEQDWSQAYVAITKNWGAEGKFISEIKSARGTHAHDVGGIDFDSVETTYDEEGNKRVRTVNYDRTSKEETYDKTERLTSAKYFDDKESEITKEEYDALRKKLKEEENKRIEETVKEEIPTVFGKSKLEEAPAPSNNTLFALVSSLAVNAVTIPARSDNCVFSITNLRTEPRHPFEYQKEFYITGAVKRTSGCPSHSSAIVKVRGEEIPVQITDKQGAFKAGPFTVDLGLVGGTGCGTAYANVAGLAPDGTFVVSQIVAKAAFFYGAYGCSDLNKCEHTGEGGKKITACQRYLGKDPCISTHIDSGCFQEVKF